MWKYKNVAIDYDGTLVENVHPLTNGKAKKGASEITNKLKDEGWEIIIFTCRPNYMRIEMEENLRSQNICFDYIAFFTKPIASLYIDDKGMRFENNWEEIYDWISEMGTKKEVIEEK